MKHKPHSKRVLVTDRGYKFNGKTYPVRRILAIVAGVVTACRVGPKETRQGIQTVLCDFFEDCVQTSDAQESILRRAGNGDGA